MQLGLQLNYKELDYVLYLDNLFASKDLALGLLEYSIGTTGTTRKSTKGIPPELLLLKQNNTDLVWGSAVNKVTDGVHFILAR